MLVLSRKKDESLYIGGCVRVVVVDVRGDKVQLGIEAPSDVSVYRSEVLEKMRREQENATEKRDKPGSGRVDEVVTLRMSRNGASLRTESKTRDDEKVVSKRGE